MVVPSDVEDVSEAFNDVKRSEIRQCIHHPDSEANSPTSISSNIFNVMTDVIIVM